MTTARSQQTDNRFLGAQLARYGTLLREQGGEPFRSRAYDRAAATIAASDVPIARLVRQGRRDAIDALPTIGPSITAALCEMVETGHWSQLDRLEGRAPALTAVPGLGQALSNRVIAKLGLETRADLERALRDRTLASVRGLGRQRIAQVRHALAHRREDAPASRPPVAMLLAVDRDYRLGASAQTLPRIAPKMFNPTSSAWLPILHESRSGWHFTALYSNSARAHQLGRLRDWVIISFHRDDEPVEQQCTVVTERRGALAGRRVVRGREAECLSIEPFS